MFIGIAFGERFRDAMLQDVTNCTTRYRCLGKAGDHFNAFGAVFTIDHVKRVYLGRVAKYNYLSEGFTSTRTFIDYWLTLHPKRGFLPNDVVYFHEFHRRR